MKLSIAEASAEFGHSQLTIKKGLIANGTEVKPRQKFTIREIHNALASDGKVARARRDLAQAEAIERKNRLAERELVSVADVNKTFNGIFLAIRQRIIALPGEQAAKCNPADPEFARASLDNWVKEFMPFARADILKVLKSTSVRKRKTEPATEIVSDEGDEQE